jgi:hypothetical protein
MDWVPIDFGEIFDKRKPFPSQKGMSKVVEMDFSPEKHVEQPYNYRCPDGPDTTGRATHDTKKHDTNTTLINIYIDWIQYMHK